jgi:hypothetical protein
MTSARLIWLAAGSPPPQDAVPAEGRCLWCGGDVAPIGRPSGSLPGTFHDAVGRDAYDLSAPFVCAPCGWTLSDRATLPDDVARRQLDKALPDGGRADLDLPGRSTSRVLVLPLADVAGRGWVHGAGGASVGDGEGGGGGEKVAGGCCGWVDSGIPFLV